MAKAMIVFEDVNPDTNEGKPVKVEYMTMRQTDCQDEPTFAEASAQAFLLLMDDIIASEEVKAQE